MLLFVQGRQDVPDMFLSAEQNRVEVNRVITSL